MKEYDEKVPSKYIMYLDANNLYGWTMCQYLPKAQGGGELVDFYDGGDHVRLFSQTPKYVDQIFQRPQIC